MNSVAFATPFIDSWKLHEPNGYNFVNKPVFQVLCHCMDLSRLVAQDEPLTSGPWVAHWQGERVAQHHCTLQCGFRSASKSQSLSAKYFVNVLNYTWRTQHLLTSNGPEKLQEPFNLRKALTIKGFVGHTWDCIPLWKLLANEISFYGRPWTCLWTTHNDSISFI